MMMLAVRENDLSTADSLIARLGKDFGDSALFAVAHGDSVLVTRLVRETRGQPLDLALRAPWEVSTFLQRPAAAEPFARAVAARPDALVEVGLTLGYPHGNTVLPENLLSQGRWAEADSVLAAGKRAAGDPRTRVLRGFWASLPFLAVPRTQLEGIRADVAAWDPRRQPGPPGPASELLPQVQRYVLGLLASRMGEGDAALIEAARLEAATVDPAYQPVMRSLAVTVRADVALSAHRPADALKWLEAVRGEVPIDLRGAIPFQEEYAHFLRGEALLAVGKDDEAQRWFENGFVQSRSEMTFAAQAALRLGGIYERKNERQRAIDSYARFARLWSACDPRVRPTVTDAEARLARLAKEPMP